jgi:hypothetical protein
MTRVVASAPAQRTGNQNATAHIVAHYFIRHEGRRPATTASSDHGVHVNVIGSPGNGSRLLVLGPQRGVVSLEAASPRPYVRAMGEHIGRKPTPPPNLC